MRPVRILAAIAIAIGFSSCSLGFPGQAHGTIVIGLPGAPGARPLTNAWPMGGMPVFSRITVTVSGSGMATITADFDPGSPTMELDVPIGDSRIVTVTAVPDWEATAEVYVEAALPTLVTAYSATDDVAVESGRTTQVSLRLSVGGSKILVPLSTYSGGGMFTWSGTGLADSLAIETLQTSSINSVTEDSFFTFDRYGHLYVSSGSAVQVYTDPDQDPVTVDFATSIFDVAWSDEDNRLYGYYDGDGCNLHYVNLDDDSVVEVGEPEGYGFSSGGVAVDSEGQVYAIAYDQDYYVDYVIKITPGTPMEGSASSSIVRSASLESLGLGQMVSGEGEPYFEPFAIEDLAIRDDVLYIAASDINSDQYSSSLKSRGMVVSVSCDTLSRRWTAGWSGTDNDFPTNPASQFYGPRRFVAIAPRKLYVIDDGFSWSGSSGNLVDVDRVVELDTGTGAITGTGLSGSSDFYYDFSDIYVC